MNIEVFIKSTEEEIKQLELDIPKCNEDLSVRILQQAIKSRKDRIEEVKKKYFNEGNK